MKMATDEQHSATDSLFDSDGVVAGDENEDDVVEFKDAAVESGAERKRKRDLLWRKRLNTLFLGLAYTCLCIAYSVLGPTFLDLVQIANANIEQGSVIFTGVSVGYLAGCLTCGLILEKVNQDMLLFVSTFGMGAFIIVPPWIPDLAGMSVMEACAAFCTGVLDTAINAVCMLIWGVKAGPYMQAVHLMYAVGGLLAPLIAEPFLMEKSNTSMIVSNSDNLINNSTGRTGNGQSISLNTTLSHQPETKVQFAFLICGLIAIATSFTFIYMYFINKRHTKWNRNLQVELENEKANLKMSSRIVYLILLALFFLLYTCLEDTIMNFMAAFVVKYADWSRSDGANVMSLYWGSFAAARLLSVPIAKYLSPWTMILVDYTILLTTFILLCLWANITAVLWAAAAMLGLSIASIFPTAFTWTEMNIMKVDGRIASLFLITGAVGSVTNPLIIGYLFEQHTPMWFVWLLSGECILNILIFIVITILTKVKYGHISTARQSDQIVDESL